MKQFTHLIKHDFLLLYRNKILMVSLMVTLVYMAVLKTIAHYGNTDKILVLIIFNDPAVLGFLFVGVMVLFEKNENTQQVLAVSPMLESNYILSKAITLTSISLVCCFAMVIFLDKKFFNPFHYFFAVTITTLLFTFLGFWIVAKVNSFNRFMLKSVGLLVALSAPFLSYYEITSRKWFLLFPTQPCIDLFRASFENDISGFDLAYGYFASLLWLFLMYRVAFKLTKANLSN